MKNLLRIIINGVINIIGYKLVKVSLKMLETGKYYYQLNIKTSTNLPHTNSCSFDHSLSFTQFSFQYFPILLNHTKIIYDFYLISLL